MAQQNTDVSASHPESLTTNRLGAGDLSLCDRKQPQDRVAILGLFFAFELPSRRGIIIAMVVKLVNQIFYPLILRL